MDPKRQNKKGQANQEEKKGSYAKSSEQRIKDNTKRYYERQQKLQDFLQRLEEEKEMVLDSQFNKYFPAPQSRPTKSKLQNYEESPKVVAKGNNMKQQEIKTVIDSKRASNSLDEKLLRTTKFNRQREMEFKNEINVINQLTLTTRNQSFNLPKNMIKEQETSKKYESLLLPPLKTIQLNQTSGFKTYFQDYFATASKANDTLNKTINTIQEEQLSAGYISKKELAKYKKLVKTEGPDIISYKRLDDTHEHDINMKDIITSEDGDDDDQEYYQTFDDEEVETSDNEFWEELKQKTQDQQIYGIQSRVDQKLEEYLRLHSEQLSSHVQEYLNLKQSGKQLSAEQQISNLGLIAFERKQFVESLQKLKKSFNVYYKQVKFMSRIKAKEYVNKMYSKIQQLFVQETQVILDQFKIMRKEWQASLLEQDKMIRILKSQEEQIISRDKAYEVIPARFLDLVEDMENLVGRDGMRRIEDSKAVEEDVISSTSLMKEVFNFYNSHIQLSMNLKDEILESKMTKIYLNEMKLIREKLTEKDAVIDTQQKVIEIYLQQQEKDKLMIETLQKELNQKIRMAELEQERFYTKYKKSYDEYSSISTKLRNEYISYIQLSEVENDIKDQIIMRLKETISKQFEELKSMKTVLSVPRLRNQVGMYNIKSAQYDQFIEQLNEIIKSSVSGSKVNSILPLQNQQSDSFYDQNLMHQIALLGLIKNPYNNQETDNIDQLNNDSGDENSGKSEFWRSKQAIDTNTPVTIQNRASSLNKFSQIGNTMSKLEFGGRRSPSQIEFKNKLNSMKKIHQRTTSTNMLENVTQKIDNVYTKRLLRRISPSPKSTQIGTNMRNSNKKHDISKTDNFQAFLNESLKESKIQIPIDVTAGRNNNGMNFTLGNFASVAAYANQSKTTLQNIYDSIRTSKNYEPKIHNATMDIDNSKSNL